MQRLDDDPTIPPAGRRTGVGTGSIVPFLARSLALKPQAMPDEQAGEAEPVATRDRLAHEAKADRASGDQGGAPGGNRTHI